MVNYEKLGYKTLNEYHIDFLETLLPTNRTYGFFVNWEKVFSNLENKIVEISILNSLSKLPKEKVEIKFKEIIIKYPECIPILPAILAIRDKKLDVFDLENQTIKKFDFSSQKFNTKDIVDFSKETGLLNLFNEIDDLYSYLTGTEVGLDTNGRKNRSGHIFENIVGNLLNDIVKDKKNYTLKIEDIINLKNRTKRFDFIVYEKNKPRVVFECNFYNTTGSKPIETANAYIDLQEQISDLNMTFIWVTDGFGWKKMFTSLKPAMKNIDYVLNYNLLKDNVEKILF
ncbi:MAG: type II restriction endonuclease [Methanobrevibacter sp.]|jgi:type II restriction enzyme|nr:type II restriction endonuclease [Candidatus Methanoflexus mossambicus]